ncbi:hypothetical protein XfCFBP8082_09120 [Xylella fastidiosa subsp. fastidiosa]|nr:hypothetical protein [Xylella fastidiosa subsp. fastidiosa]QIS26198.1 hypothetical protein F7G16_08420 [Xylella fastidiosa]RWA45099.1 hypothetical protein XfCFBP8356_02355 [Xylella fastidiosa subsp. sandyi]RUA37210.1 hypothetical protein DX877_06255 [Xylella fastidiosa subsp. fastidiosa]RUA37293.1 hypothetical protein DX878_06490 [Xylella fastidiosa subsp. fastidiosa]
MIGLWITHPHHGYASCQTTLQQATYTTDWIPVIAQQPPFSLQLFKMLPCGKPATHRAPFNQRQTTRCTASIGPSHYIFLWTQFTIASRGF